MINNNMNNDKSKSNDKSQGVANESKPNESKPNEISGVYISTHVKIFDPNTKEVLMQKRGDD